MKRQDNSKIILHLAVQQRAVLIEFALWRVLQRTGCWLCCNGNRLNDHWVLWCLHSFFFQVSFSIQGLWAASFCLELCPCNKEQNGQNLCLLGAYILISENQDGMIMMAELQIWIRGICNQGKKDKLRLYKLSHCLIKGSILFYGKRQIFPLTLNSRRFLLHDSYLKSNQWVR